MSIEGFVRSLQDRKVEINRELAAKPDRWRKANLNRELKCINEKLKLALRERIR